MSHIPYIEEILSQPEALLAALPRYDLTPLEPLCRAIQHGEYDRIILTGMGASLYGAYPAWLLLAQAGLPAYWVDAAELLHYAGSLVTPRSLLWIISQSGRSAELIPLLEPSWNHRPARLLATTNDLASPLAQAADLALSIDAPVELTVSTRTYTNTLAITQLAAQALASGETGSQSKTLATAYSQLEKTGQAMAEYLKNWQEHVAALGQTLGTPQNLVLLGRGPSLAAVLTGTLILAEASKTMTTPMNAAEFRHGPLEMTGPRLTILTFLGQDSAIPLNQRLVHDLRGYGASAFLIAPQPDAELPVLAMPPAAGIGLPLAEILPLQMLTITLAEQQGLEPGKFYRAGKVVLAE